MKLNYLNGDDDGGGDGGNGDQLNHLNYSRQEKQLY